ncbi:hypothetical protein BDP27DRAFT_1418251 [Rhodocollybia butyracea]|uniref:FAS1 domain-containing protein n=1 Tax=Rhodocollybia butyracea TaxID=206335 RepID=A0A9P5Q2F6_9AGAR|nr:hypothetical protein BDP27DRAFT_1418251 [Rhodocollybia butyracea]
MRHHFSFFALLCLAPFSSAGSLQTPLNPPESFQAPQLQVNNMPSLADLLTIESSASIFYSYARELSLSELFSQPAGLTEDNGKGGLTLLVPTNKAVMAMERKPHQGPPPKDNEDISISEEEFFRNSKDNVLRWVQAHVIPTSPLTFPLPSTTYDTLLDGKSVTFSSGNVDEEDWKKVTVEGTHILDMKQASNGVMYIIDGTINTY